MGVVGSIGPAGDCCEATSDTVGILNVGHEKLYSVCAVCSVLANTLLYVDFRRRVILVSLSKDGSIRSAIGIYLSCSCSCLPRHQHRQSFHVKTTKQQQEHSAYVCRFFRKQIYLCSLCSHRVSLYLPKVQQADSAPDKGQLELSRGFTPSMGRPTRHLP